MSLVQTPVCGACSSAFRLSGERLGVPLPLQGSRAGAGGHGLRRVPQAGGALLLSAPLAQVGRCAAAQAPCAGGRLVGGQGPTNPPLPFCWPGSLAGMQEAPRGCYGHQRRGRGEGGAEPKSLPWPAQEALPPEARRPQTGRRCSETRLH